VGYFAIFCKEQSDIRAEIRLNIEKRKISETAYTTIKIPLEQLEEIVWIDEHEFRYKGELYDLVSQKIENGLVTIVGLNDKKEEQLIKKYEKEEKKESNSPSSHKKRKLPTLEYLNPKKKWAFMDNTDNHEVRTKYQFCSNFVFISPPSPPPQKMS
jgi:primosomal protein N'